LPTKPRSPRRSTIPGSAASISSDSIIGEWAEGASVVFLFSLAQVLETYSMDRARNAIKALMDLSPTEATVRRDGREETVPASEVRLGEAIIVRPGQKIPLDGEVLSGRSAVNQAPITGESMPVDKEPGSEVFAGSINEQGLLEVRVTKLVSDTTLARIIHAVEEAQASRAPSQSFVDRFSRYYTPAVVALAVFVFLIPPLVGLGLFGAPAAGMVQDFADFGDMAREHRGKPAERVDIFLDLAQSRVKGNNLASDGVTEVA